MKKLILWVTAIIFALPIQIQTAFADRNNGSLNPFQVKQQVELLADQLYLVGKQRQQFMEIFKQQYMKFQSPPNAISDEARSSIKLLLTKEQFMQFNTLTNNH